MAKVSKQDQDDRLGNILIQRKVITARQLDQAVQCQVLFGGRLGTNLLELGFVTESGLREILVEKTRIDAVTREDLADIPEKVFGAVSRGFADKHKLIPFKKDDEGLAVAMLDPFKDSSIRALTEQTGQRIKPRIALELDLYWALEKYYAIKREARYINLDRYLAHQREGERKKKEEKKTEAFISEPLFPDPNNITAVEGVPQDLDDFWDRVGRTGHPEYLLPRVLKDLENATSRDEIAGIILDLAGMVFMRSLLFVVNEGMLFGWDGRGEGISSRLALGIMLPLNRRSVFKTVVDTGAYFLGPIPDSPINRRFQAVLGDVPPKTSLLIPVFVSGRVAAILYGDMGPKEEVNTRISPLQRALNAAGQAFHRLIVTQKADNPKAPKS